MQTIRSPRFVLARLFTLHLPASRAPRAEPSLSRCIHVGSHCFLLRASVSLCLWGVLRALRSLRPLRSVSATGPLDRRGELALEPGIIPGRFEVTERVVVRAAAAD